jgi:hypothetical protein
MTPSSKILIQTMTQLLVSLFMLVAALVVEVLLPTGTQYYGSYPNVATGGQGLLVTGTSSSGTSTSQHFFFCCCGNSERIFCQRS